MVKPIETTKDLLTLDTVLGGWDGKQKRWISTSNSDIKAYRKDGTDSPLSIKTVKQLYTYDELSFWNILSGSGVVIRYQYNLSITLKGNARSLKLTVVNTLTHAIEQYTIANKSFLDARTTATNTNVIDVMNSLHRMFNK